MLVGASGAGKSMLLLQAIQAWEQGRPYPIEFEATRVAYVTSDRGGTSVDGRIARLGLKKVEHYNIVNDVSLSKSTITNHELLLSAVMKKLQHPFDLLVLDPIGLFLPAGLNDYHKAAWGMVSMNRFAAKNGMTIIGVHHATKIKTDSDFLRPQDRISGSSALQGYTSSQIILIQGSEKGSEIDQLHIIHHDAPPEMYELVRNDEGLFVLHKDVERKRRSPNETAILSVIRAMPEEEFTVQDIIERTGIPQPTVYRILKGFQIEGKIEKIRQGAYKKIGGWLSAVNSELSLRECMA